ncbi:MULTISPECIES: hypothetical protein [unclassified Phaeobacter]
MEKLKIKYGNLTVEAVGISVWAWGMVLLAVVLTAIGTAHLWL